MSEKLSLSSTAILRSEPQYYNTHAVFDYRRVNTEFLNAEESRILQCIYDKSASAREISKEIGINYKRCEKFLKHMKESGYVQGDADIEKAKPPERIRISSEAYERFTLPFLSAPASVDVFITSRCNLLCLHCFADAGKANAQELPLSNLKSIFDQLEKMGVLELRINGGEPLLHREVRRVLSYLGQKRFRKVLLTNGTLLDEEIALLMHESGTIPTVSLDDSLAEGHDLFRGVKGSFRRTIAALEILQRHGIEYGINCCLQKNNLNRYEEIIGLAAKHGAARITFLDIKPMGRIKGSSNWVPSYPEYEKVMNDLVVAKAKHREIDVSVDAFLHCTPLKESVLEARKGYVSCQAGKTRLVIDSQGLVYPCNLVVSDPRWIMGDLKKEKIWDAWFSEKWTFFRGKVRTDDLQKCRDCRKLEKCKDFYCRFLPYLVNGNLLGPHPACA